MSSSAIKLPGPGWGLGLGALVLLLPAGIWLGRSHPCLLPSATRQAVASTDLRPTMVVLPAGIPMMDSRKHQAQSQHSVMLPYKLALSATEVTQAHYQAVMLHNPAGYRDRHNWRDLPVESVSWRDAIEYCNRLSLLEGLTPCYQLAGPDAQQPGAVSWPQGVSCAGYRLPTELEWEYAARAGSANESADADLSQAGGISESDRDGGPHPVTSQPPNAWGLYDLRGNVMEWVWDEHDSFRPEAPADSRDTGSWAAIADDKKSLLGNPLGVPQGHALRVVRGGSARSGAEVSRITHRNGYEPHVRYSTLGFRLARSYP